MQSINSQEIVDGFIRAMAAAPDSDAPRLVFADWLDEHGDADRAEFIRLQVGPNASDMAPVARANELLSLHRDEWEAPFRAIGAEVWFQRGFPCYLKANLRQIADNPEVLALAPEWRLSPTWETNSASKVEACAKLAAAPWATRIHEFNFAWHVYRPDEITALLTPKIIPGITGLRFGDDDKKRGILDLILTLPDLRLSELGFGGDSYEGVGDDGCRVIALSPSLGGLRVLELPNNEIGPEGAAALARSAHVRGLVYLDLAGGSNSPNQIEAEGARHLAQSDGFTQLKNLNLVFNHIGDEGFIALAESSKLPALDSLNVPGNAIGDAAMQALARSPGLPSLTWLNVCGMSGGRQGITAAGIAELVKSPRMAKLTDLKLGGNPIGDTGATALAEAPAAAGLRELYLSGCGLSRDGFVRLLESPYLAGVREFALSHSLGVETVNELKSRYGNRVK